MGRGFSRERGVKFHPSVKNSTLACKIGQAFSLFTNCTGQPGPANARYPHDLHAALYRILDQDLGYVLLHSSVAGKTGISVEKKQNGERGK
jgi:hypothetical protein